MSALLVCLSTHALAQHAPLVRNATVVPNGAEHWICVVLHGSVRVWKAESAGAGQVRTRIQTQL
jgi:hypothetical protein